MRMQKLHETRCREPRALTLAGAALAKTRGSLVCACVLLTTGCASTGPTADVVYLPPPPAAPHAVHLKSFNTVSELVPIRRSFADVIRGRLLRPYVDTPAGVAFARGHLYICDTGSAVVHDWNLTTGEARRIGGFGEAILSEPLAVAVDDEGLIYVADADRGEVVAYDAAGSLVRLIKPASRDDYRPVAVAVAGGGRLYVADVASHQIDVFSTEDGQRIESFGGPGSDPGRFYFPTGVAASRGLQPSRTPRGRQQAGFARPAARVFVSDMMNARVQVFDSVHKPVLSMGQPGDRYGDMGKPKHLSVGPDGTLFIADAHFARVHLFDGEGRLLMLLGNERNEPGFMAMPCGVAVASSLPDRLASLVPGDFRASYFVFVTNKFGAKRVSLFAIGEKGTASGE